jgi:hypothetical protein
LYVMSIVQKIIFLSFDCFAVDRQH